MKDTTSSSASKILFLGHEASRTGAPWLLLQFLRWLKNNSAFTPELLLKNGGALTPEFQAALPVHHFADLVPWWSRELPPRVWRKLGLAKFCQPKLNRLFPASKYPLVYANTIACLEMARELCQSQRRCILHVHELDYAVRWFKMENALRDSANFVATYVATSAAVRDYLVKKIGLPAERIVVVHGFPIACLTTATERAENRRAVRAALGIADGTFVVGMCGTPDWRKGIDLFIQLALQLKKSSGQIFKCVWVGGDPEDQQLRQDIAAAGLTEHLHIEPPCADPQKFYPAFDVFALTSREDPFPLTLLEAAAAGVPLVAFQGAGGAGELIEHDAGSLVPYLDVLALAEEIRRLANDPVAAKKMGERAQAKVAAHYTLASQSAKLLAVLNQSRNAAA